MSQRTLARSVYDGIDEPEEFIEWLSKKLKSLSPAERLSAKMHVGRGIDVTMIGISYFSTDNRSPQDTNGARQDG